MPEELEQRVSHYGLMEIQAHYALKDKKNPIHTAINEDILKHWIRDPNDD